MKDFDDLYFDPKTATAVLNFENGYGVRVIRLFNGFFDAFRLKESQHTGKAALCRTDSDVSRFMLDTQMLSRVGSEKKSSHYPLGEFDAQKWAKEFMLLFGERKNEIDEALMHSWFANAIMTGHDHAKQNPPPKACWLDNKTLALMTATIYSAFRIINIIVEAGGTILVKEQDPLFKEKLALEKAKAIVRLIEEGEFKE